MKIHLYSTISSLLKRYISWKAHNNYEQGYYKLMKRNCIPDTLVDGETEYIERWRGLSGYKSPYAYRLFSHYIPSNLRRDIIDQTVANRINEVLNPPRYSGYYGDKNVFDAIFGKNVLPTTILRRIDSDFYTADYQPIISHAELGNLLSNIKKLPYSNIVLKPSVSDSGRGVELFERRGEKYVNRRSNEVLNEQFLVSLNQDFIMQEGMEQSDFMSTLNPTSVNTIRIATYRSVVDNEVHILSSVIRIGANGASVDNLHAGGAMIRVDENGFLANCLFNQYGERTKEHNGINFSSSELIVPNWGNVLDFARKVAAQVTFARLLQLDVMIDSKGAPRLIEFNCQAFSCWIAQFTGTPALGEYTDEIYDFIGSSVRQ